RSFFSAFLPATLRRSASHALGVAVPSGSAARTLSRQSPAIVAESVCVPEQVPDLAKAVENFVSTVFWHAVRSDGSPFCATFDSQVRSPASVLAIAFRRRLVHLSARAVPAERTRAAIRSVPTATARGWSFDMMSVLPCDGPDERAGHTEAYAVHVSEVNPN